MHVFKDSCVQKVHAKRVTQLENLLADVVRVLSRFVQKDAFPNSEGVSGILVQDFGTYPGAHFLDRLLNRSSHFSSRHVHHGCFLLVR
jgi:hypothetical protein